MEIKDILLQMLKEEEKVNLRRINSIILNTRLMAKKIILDLLNAKENPEKSYILFYDKIGSIEWNSILGNNIKYNSLEYNNYMKQLLEKVLGISDTFINPEFNFVKINGVLNNNLVIFELLMEELNSLNINAFVSDEVKVEENNRYLHVHTSLENLRQIDKKSIISVREEIEKELESILILQNSFTMKDTLKNLIMSSKTDSEELKNNTYLLIYEFWKSLYFEWCTNSNEKISITNNVLDCLLFRSRREKYYFTCIPDKLKELEKQLSCRVISSRSYIFKNLITINYDIVKKEFKNYFINCDLDYPFFLTLETSKENLTRIFIGNLDLENNLEETMNFYKYIRK